jgi:hypothetical protein
MMINSKIHSFGLETTQKGKHKKSNQEEARSSGRNIPVDVETIYTSAAPHRKDQGEGVQRRVL